MPEHSEQPEANREEPAASRADHIASDRALRNFRYVVASVNRDAEQAWTDLWEELRGGVTPAGAVLPALEEGFIPSCGWAAFLEKFWLLKHYLDYIEHFCQSANP